MVPLDSPYTTSYLCLIVTHGRTPLRDASLQNLGNLKFDLSRLLKVKCDGPVAHPMIYDFLLLFNNNIMAYEYMLSKSDINRDLSTSPTVKPNGAVELPYNVLLLPN